VLLIWIARTVDGNGDPVPNPQTKAQFVKQVVINFLKTTVKDHEARVAANAAFDAARSKAESEVSIT